PRGWIRQASAVHLVVSARFGAVPERRLLLWPEGSRRAAGTEEAGSRQGDRFRLVRLPRRPAVSRPEGGEKLRRQLRLFDLGADDSDQPCDVPAPPQERGLDAQDAGTAAADEGDSGSVRE